jgi:hypothetical protein
VVRAPTSLPACGSVRFMVPVQSPAIRRGTTRSRREGSAWATSASIWPCDIKGAIDSAMQAPAKVSLTMAVSAIGRPSPPWPASAAIPMKPPAAMARCAAA